MRDIRYLKSIEEMKIPEMELYVSNKEVHLLRYYEPEPGIFIAESKNVIERALSKGFKPISVIALPEKLKEEALFDEIGDVPIFAGELKLLQEFLGYKLTSGITCAMRRKKAPDYKEVIKDAKRIGVMEACVNPTNLGAIFRSAAALGIDALLLSPACVDPLYRRAIRVSVGNVFLIPWAYIGYNEEEWKTKGVEMLKAEGFTTVAMALREDNVNINDERLKACDKLAIIMGTEGDGLCDNTIASCDYVAKIPMANEVDSLNVSVAASLAFWELGTVNQ